MKEENQINFNDFAKLDLRIGKIINVEDHPNADKLYVLTINFGNEIGKRVIVAGLKPYYKKEDLKDKKAVFITNLEPVTLRGIKSEGMILAASTPDKSHICILKPDSEDIEEGSKIS
ncbi:MAG: hypothetical protein Q8P57_03630 [Candidatus Pacearchaeota archaeon]|nr:hypothetical protein [Candidatus Pacearchaeota archaeon]